MFPSTSPKSHIVVLAGGIGGARFIAGVRRAAPAADITVIGNTGDDIWLFGLRVCPDLDTLMYTLGGVADQDRGWGRADETFHAAEELAAFGAQPDWFGLGDRDLATHLIRTQMITAGYPLSDITAALCKRFDLGVTLLPMSDDRVETHVVVDDPDTGRRAIHFQEWWVRHRAGLPAESFAFVGIDQATPAPGVLDAIAGADAILFAPSNPVVSLGPLLAVPGMSKAIAGAAAPVVGVSGIVGGRPVRGMADACLAAIGVPTTAAGVALHFGARPQGLLDGWVIDEADRDQLAEIAAAGIFAAATPSLMVDDAAAQHLAQAALDVAAQISRS